MLPRSSAWLLGITSIALITLSVAGILADPLSLPMQLSTLVVAVLLLALSVIRLALRQRS